MPTLLRNPEKGNRKNGHIPKRKRVLNESLDEKILGLYALGMSVQEIADHMDEV